MHCSRHKMPRIVKKGAALPGALAACSGSGSDRTSQPSPVRPAAAERTAPDAAEVRQRACALPEPAEGPRADRRIHAGAAGGRVRLKGPVLGVWQAESALSD